MTMPLDRAPQLRVADRLPAGAIVKRRCGIRELLEWAFAQEHARVEFGTAGELAVGHRPTYGVEFKLLRMAQLGGVAIDTSQGRSRPADDAELVAAVVAKCLLPQRAVIVAEHARACSMPDAMVDVVPKCVPVAWSGQTRYGPRAKTERVGEFQYRVNNRVRRKEIRWCPVTFTPSASRIAAARRAYLDWWGSLLEIFSSCRALEFKAFELTDAMPPMQPWLRNS